MNKIAALPHEYTSQNELKRYLYHHHEEKKDRDQSFENLLPTDFLIRTSKSMEKASAERRMRVNLASNRQIQHVVNSIYVFKGKFVRYRLKDLKYDVFRRGYLRCSNFPVKDASKPEEIVDPKNTTSKNTAQEKTTSTPDTSNSTSTEPRSVLLPKNGLLFCQASKSPDGDTT